MATISDRSQRFDGSTRKLNLSFRNLAVNGGTNTRNYFPTLFTAPLELFHWVFNSKVNPPKILDALDGQIDGGTMLLVLGRPGSGCSTLLKTLAGHMVGLTIDPTSEVLYEDVPFSMMHERYKSQCIYLAETDVHFPELTVGETIQFAAEACSKRVVVPNGSETSRSGLRAHWQSIQTTLQLDSVSQTIIGSAVHRGVSGGEKRRVTLGETLLSNASLQCWDNSTRGMDSATALTIIQAFQTSAKSHGSIAVASLYQASQAVVDLFDCILLLYDGSQIFFGTTSEAIDYFTGLGFEMHQRTSAADYLTAITNPAEARQLVREGIEHFPRTKEDFVRTWKESHLYHDLIQRIEKQRSEGTSSARFDNHITRSTHNISISKEIEICMGRCYRRIINSISIPVSAVVGNAVLAAIIGGLFLNLDETAASVTIRSNLLFLSVLLNGFMSGSEVFTIWAQRPIVEKHSRYGFYHPFAESISALACDIPIKLLSSLCFNVILYFMANLRRSPEAFFTYWLFAFVCHVTLSTWFRCAGSFCKTFGQLTLPLGIWHLALITYSGYVVPVQYMRGWLHWIRYLNPMTYAFESMIVNEFRGRKFPCRSFIPFGPDYDSIPSGSRVCAQIGASSSVSGTYVDGTTYIREGLGFDPNNIWRNLGILLALLAAYLVMHLVASEYILVEAPGADVLLYSRNSTIRERFRTQKRDEESTTPGRLHRHNEVIDLEKVPRKLQNIEGILYWKNLSYEIPGSRHQKPLHLLTDVSGLVEPGKLTALMGATGAGKTTLLDVLSGRVSIGTISGQISYQRKLIVDQSLPRIGFVQQQDIHLSTSTVREALQFSATMRSEGGTLPEKMEYVEEVINILGMHPFANAMIGTPGQGLNVEQLRRLSIGVELVAKPDILLLDEPTSGLDSQTAWAICSLLQDLVQHGQTILCTIHQPSANLFEMFDKLLLIEKEGKVLYYGDIGNQAGTVTAYFQSKGGPEVLCASDQNPADWLFDIISTPGTDWYRHWRDSSEFLNLQKRLTGLCEAQTQSRVLERLAPPQKARAVHLFSQVFTLTRRTFTSYWRTPQYLWGNLIFTMGAAALISISCPSTSNGLQGLTIQVFAIFLFCTIFSNLSHQMLPNFVKYRDLFEIREGRSHTYSWQAFLTSIILVEGFWSTVASVLAFALFYFPLNMHNGDSISALLAWLYIWGFFLFTSTLSHLLMAGLEHAEVAANYGFLLFYLCLIFCGVLVPKEQLGSFWIFMYRVSPLTYIVAGLLTVGISHREVHCLEDELVLLDNPTLTTCREYLAPYLKSVGGRLLNPDAETDCQICPVAKGQEFLSTLNVEWASRWQYLGYIFAFVFFNVLMTFLLYWAVRVRKMRSIKIIDKDIKY